jgi:hypothetical protein
MTAVYLAETLVYPYVNERRIILVLPVVLAWYALGAWLCLRLVGRAVAQVQPALQVQRPLAVLLAVLVAVPLLLQVHRNYRFESGQETSHPLGSPYLEFVRAVTGPRDVVETAYLWTTALGTGRKTATSAFTSTCTATGVRQAAYDDGAGILVTAAFNQPPPAPHCPSAVLEDAAWALPLYATGLDDATVWQLIGPGTRNPDLSDAVSGPGTVTTSPDSTTVSWTWASPRALTQLSVGAAAARTGRTSAVRLEWQDPSGAWHGAAATSGAVGPTAATPFLVARLSTPESATGVRLVVVGGQGADVDSVHALTRGGS